VQQNGEGAPRRLPGNARLVVDTLYRSGRSQAQRLPQLAVQKLEDQATIYQAYLWLGAQAAGQVILDHLSATVLLQPCATLQDEGKRLLVLQMLRMIATAPEELERLRAERACGQDVVL
jgi:hypothetical protein